MKSYVMSMIVDAALGEYGGLFETVVVLDDMVEVGGSWAQLEGRQWNVCVAIQKKKKDLECLKAEGFAMVEAMVRECVVVGAFKMDRRDLVRIQDWLRGTRNCVGDVQVVDRIDPIKVSEYAGTDRTSGVWRR